MTGKGLLLGPHRLVGRGTLGLPLKCPDCAYRFLKTPWYNPPFRKLGKSRLCPNCNVVLRADKANPGSAPPKLWKS